MTSGGAAAAAAAAGAAMSADADAAILQFLSAEPSKAAEELAKFVRPKPGKIINWDLAQELYSSVKTDNFYAKFLWPELCQSFAILKDKKRNGPELYAYESIYHVKYEILALIEVHKRFQPKHIDKKLKDEFISILTYACKYWMQSADELLLNWSPLEDRNYRELLLSYEMMIVNYEYLIPLFFDMIKGLGRGDSRTRFQLVPATHIGIGIYLGAVVSKWKLNNYVLEDNTDVEKQLIALRTTLLKDKSIVKFATTHKTGTNEKGESQDFNNKGELQQILERHYVNLIQQKTTQHPYLKNVLVRIVQEKKKYRVINYEIGPFALTAENDLNTKTAEEVSGAIRNLDTIILKSFGPQPSASAHKDQSTTASTIDHVLICLFNTFEICIKNQNFIGLSDLNVLIKSFKQVEDRYFKTSLPLNWLIKSHLNIFFGTLNRLQVDKATAKIMAETVPAFGKVTGTEDLDGLFPMGAWKATEDDWHKARAYLYEQGLPQKDRKIPIRTSPIESNLDNLLKTFKVVIYHPNDFSSKEVMMAITLIHNYKERNEATHVPHDDMNVYLELYRKTLNTICLQKLTKKEEDSSTPSSYLNDYIFRLGTTGVSHADGDLSTQSPIEALINAVRLKNPESRKIEVARISEENQVFFQSPAGIKLFEQAFREFFQYHKQNIVGTPENNAKCYYSYMEGIYVLRACTSLFRENNTSIVTLFINGYKFLRYVGNAIKIRNNLLLSNQLTHDLLTVEDDSLQDLFSISDFTLKVLSEVASSPDANPFYGRDNSILSLLTETLQSYIALESFFEELACKTPDHKTEDASQFYLLRLQCQKYSQVYLDLIKLLHRNKKFSTTPIDYPSLLPKWQSEITTSSKNLRVFADTYRLLPDTLEKKIPQDVTDMLSSFGAMTQLLSDVPEDAECAAGAGGAAAAAAAGVDNDVALRQARQRIKSLQELNEASEAVSANDKAKIKELEQQLERAEAELVQLRGQIDQLQRDSEKSAERLCNQRSEISTLTGKFTSLQAAHAALTSDVEDQRRAATGHQRKAQQATAQLKAKDAELEILQPQLAAAQCTIRANQEARSALRKETAAQVAQAKTEAEVRAAAQIEDLTARLKDMTLGADRLRDQSEAQAATAAANEAKAAAREKALTEELAQSKAELRAILSTGDEVDCNFDFRKISQTPAKPIAEILATLAQQEQSLGTDKRLLEPRSSDKALLSKVKNLVRTLGQDEPEPTIKSARHGAAAAGADPAAEETIHTFKHRTYIDGGYPRCHFNWFFHQAEVRHNDIDLITTRSVDWMKQRERDGKVTIADFNFEQNKKLPHLWTDRHNKIDLVCNPNLSLNFEASQRDLTCNALFVMLNEQNQWVVLDPTRQGINDIKDRKLSVIDDIKKRMFEDPSRILRLLRFLIELGWGLTQEQVDIVLSFSTFMNQIPYGVFASNMYKIFNHQDALQSPILINILGNLMGCSTLLSKPQTMLYLKDVMTNDEKYTDGAHSYIHSIGLLLSIETLNQTVFTSSQIVDNFLGRWSKENLNDDDRAIHKHKLIGFVNHYVVKYQDFLAQEAAFAQHHVRAAQFAAALQQTQHEAAQTPLPPGGFSAAPPIIPSFDAFAASAAHAPPPAPGAPPPRYC